MIPTGAATFSFGEDQFIFEGKGFREVTPNGDIVYERVEAAHPSESDLASLVGRYESRETGSTVTVEANAGELTLAIASRAPFRLRATFRDAFMLPNSPTSILFLRDSAGNVTGLSAGDDRVWDLRFTRIKSNP